METIQEETTGLVVLEKKEAHLLELANKFKGLKIDGVTDKEGIKRVGEARKELKTERVQIEKDAYELREGAIKFQKAVIAKEKQLVGLIEPIEQDLSKEEKRIEAIKESIRVEEEKKENERIQDRINQLAKFNHAVDLYDAKFMTDETFQELLISAQTQYNEEQNRLAEVKAEEEKKKREEEDRIKLEREELVKQKAEQDARDRELKRQEEERIEQERVRAEQIRKEDEERQASIKAERDKLEAERKEFEERKRKEQEEIQSKERARLEAERLITEKENRDRLAKEEAERIETLKPDRVKLLDFASSIDLIKVPTLESEEANAIRKEIISDLSTLKKKIIKNSNKLIESKQDEALPVGG